MESSLLNAGGTNEINRRSIPKQKLAPECTKMSISFLNTSDSGLLFNTSDPLEVDDGVESREEGSDIICKLDKDRDKSLLSG